MTDEQDNSLDRYFRDARAELSDAEFTSNAMRQVRRHERCSAVLRAMAWIGVLVVAGIFAPFIQNDFLLLSAIPGEASLSSAGAMMSLAQVPLIFMVGLAGVGYFLLDSL